MEPIALRVNDAGKLVGLSRSQIYRLINEGKLEAIKAGGRTLIKYASLRALIDSADRIAA